MAQRSGTGPLPSQLRTTVVKLTDQGRTRDHNEDRVRVEIPQDSRLLQAKGALYIVADGMGGHEAGEVASAIAIDVFPQAYYQDTQADLRICLQNAVRQANHAVFTRAQQSPGRKGMGTTIVAAAVRNGELYLAHVGDSRAYLLRQGKFEPLTKDHSFVQEQIDAGILTEEMARNHPQKNVITRALGHGPEVTPTISGPIPLQPGDRLLLCSDGLSGPLRDEDMAAILKQHPVRDAVPQLVDLANERGGPDNISVALALVEPWQPNQPIAQELSPRQVAAPNGPLSGLSPAVPPTPPPATGTFPWKWVSIGAAAVVALLAIIAIILSFGGRGRNGAEPTPSTPPAQMVTSTADKTVATPIISDPDGTTTPLEATATAAPLSSSPTPTESSGELLEGGGTEGSDPGCKPKLPTLVEPINGASKYAWQEVTFKWEGGERCGGEWQVTLNGEKVCPAVLEDTVTCAVELAPGEYAWRVQLHEVGNPHPRPGMMTSPLTLYLTEVGGGDEGICSPDPASKPDCGGDEPIKTENPCGWKCPGH